MSSPQSESIPAQLDELRTRGFTIARGLVPPERAAVLRELAQRQLHEAAAPLELEADLRYPGAPASTDAPGGRTVRRLLDAYTRDPEFAARATAPEIKAWMEAYFEEPAVMSRAHHNCVMTKHPHYGSLTGWHRDARYWAFERPDLVSVWIALGRENDDNGALWLVPGSHRAEFDAASFDEAKFFRADLPENQRWIERAECVDLAPGDVVFFHCNTLHSAGQNQSDDVKFSLVYTYHGASNAPVPGSRSASKSEVAL